MSNFIYHFNNQIKKTSHLSDEIKKLLGNKGRGLIEMSLLGLSVPPGFIITSSLCEYYYKNSFNFPNNFIQNDLTKAINELEEITNKKFGSAENPLLLSVRSGSSVSMPGMMDTILNLGINDEIVKGLINLTNNEIFALDSYARFLENYSCLVLNIPKESFAFINENARNYQAPSYAEKIKSLKGQINSYKEIISSYSDLKFLNDPLLQLKKAIETVIKSWMSERALTYRRLYDIPEHLGTAVNVQTMVFGNQNEKSGSGVIFTRSPSNGEKKLFGEFMFNAQGEDIVSGAKTPVTIKDDKNSLQILMPELYQELKEICLKLELHYRDAQDIEFTIENEKLYLLQTRTAKRTTQAAIKIAVDMVKEGIISKEEALMRIEPESLNQLLHSMIDYDKIQDLELAQGLPASPGAVSGIVAFSSARALELAANYPVILIRNETSPEDINGLSVSAGILTNRGGMTSHAAVVARGMGKPCVCGINTLQINEHEKFCRIASNKKLNSDEDMDIITIREGDEITIDGSSGKIFLKKLPLVTPGVSNDFLTILNWADEIAKLKVRANAETVNDTIVALNFGAQGIGLCRTEHMFFSADKLKLMRALIVAPTNQHRGAIIEKLLPLQKEDFKKILRILHGKPINIRLLDPPLHEFLPKEEKDKNELAKDLDLPIDYINQRLEELHETNPMLGHRGCRIAISSPCIYEMQVKAIFSAIHELAIEENIDSNLELMIPLVSEVNELKKIKNFILPLKEELKKDLAKKGKELKLKIGTMIEVPRAALEADKIAKEVDFFSFGTNDLTQTIFGISRDDIASFLPIYLHEKIFQHDPFVEIDQKAVGKLMIMATQEGYKSNTNLQFGVCGEHAGNSNSIEFFHKIGINYISCSPFRVPIARLSAARAVIQNKS